MPNYKLTYFNVRGRGEPMRLMFAYAKVPFEDIRIEIADWHKVKSTVPFGQVPILEVDGLQFEQSLPILLFLAKKFGLDGEDDVKRAQAHIFVSHLEDLFMKMVPVHHQQDPEKKKEMREKFISENLEPTFERLEKRVAKNGNTVDKTVLWSDFCLANFIDMLEQWHMVDADFIAKKYPYMAKVRDTVYSIPQIMAYIHKRK